MEGGGGAFTSRFRPTLRVGVRSRHERALNFITCNYKQTGLTSVSCLIVLWTH